MATRGSDALQLVRKFNFSAITLDIMLPDIDGRRVLYRLKDDPVTRHDGRQRVAVRPGAGGRQSGSGKDQHENNREDG